MNLTIYEDLFNDLFLLKVDAALHKAGHPVSSVFLTALSE